MRTKANTDNKENANLYFTVESWINLKFLSSTFARRLFSASESAVIFLQDTRILRNSKFECQIDEDEMERLVNIIVEQKFDCHTLWMNNEGREFKPEMWSTFI